MDWGVGNGYLNEVAKASRVPVLNMQCDIYHPFQCLADLMTIVEKKGRDLRRKKMVVSWAYAASYQKPMSVPQSLVLQMPRFGMDVVLAHPPEFKLMPEIMDQAREQARKFGTGFEVVDDMDEAFKDADIIYAKSWGAMVHTPDPDEGAKIIKKYESWITDERRMLPVIQSVQDGKYTRQFVWASPDWKDINNADTSVVGFKKSDGLSADASAKLDSFISELAGGLNLFTGPMNYQDGTVFLKDGEVATDQQIWYMLANIQPLVTAPIAFVFIALSKGASSLGIDLKLDSNLSGVIQGSLVIFVLIMDGVRRIISKKNKGAANG